MRLVIVSFLFLGWAFYELSGGSDFEPRKTRAELPQAEPGNVQLAAGGNRVVPDQEKVSTVIEAPEVVRLQIPDITTNKLEIKPSENPRLAYRLSQPGDQANDGSVQLASLGDADSQFPQPSNLAQGASPGNPRTPSEPAARTLDGPVIREVTGSRVNMRQGPGTTYSVIDTLFFDDKVEVLEDLGNGWVQLRKVGDDRVGWMASRFVGERVD